MSIYPPDHVAAFHSLPAFTTKTFHQIIKAGLLARAPETLTVDGLLDAGLDSNRARQILSQLPDVDRAAARAILEKFHIQVITIADAEYPVLLKEIPAPPPILYVRGNTAALQATMLAVVGTRSPTPYGLKATDLLVRPVTRHGIGVVSGLALGIDGAAHRIALDEKVPTVAVLGCGVDRIYPWQHAQLADQIIATGGVVMSEFPLGAEPRREYFPQRNRIISGLAQGVLLVEAGEKSGALITAKYAVDQNREVLAVPGPITSAQSIGPIHWIQLGAKTISTANDILEVFSVPPTYLSTTKLPGQPTDPTQAAIMNALSQDPQHVDAISASCRLEASVVSAALVLLELDGRVAHHGGMYYSLTS